MAGQSKIEWTQHTWNPIVGCSLKSPGCTHCYAMRQAHRLASNPATPHYKGTTRGSKAGPVFTGKVALAPDSVLLEPLRRKTPTIYFVNSMGDLFHENVPDEWITHAFAVMGACPQHTFQILTKRADRMRKFCASMPDDLSTEILTIARPDGFGYPAAVPAKWPFPNVWLGVSTERQQEADERIPQLLQTPAAVRFISAEPLLGPIDLEEAWHGESALDSECWGDCAWCRSGHTPLHNCRERESFYAEKGRSGLDWVIVGGESGPGARPMHPEWARTLRDQCEAAGVPFFFKQWGTWAPTEDREKAEATVTDAAWMRVGKMAAGRKLDGVEHNGMPRGAEAT